MHTTVIQLAIYMAPLARAETLRVYKTLRVWAFGRHSANSPHKKHAHNQG
jgi:hypothetical protein